MSGRERRERAAEAEADARPLSRLADCLVGAIDETLLAGGNPHDPNCTRPASHSGRLSLTTAQRRTLLLAREKLQNSLFGSQAEPFIAIEIIHTADSINRMGGIA